MAIQINVNNENPDSEQSPLVAEQRGARRVALFIRTAKLIADGREYLCVIRDVSASGVRVRTFHPIPEHQKLLLETDRGDRHPVELVWRTRDHAGFRFFEEVDVQRFVEDKHAAFPRRRIRMDLSLDAWLYANCQLSKVVIRNISQQGAGIECERWLTIGELVRIETNVFSPIYAKVCWRRPPMYGLIFEQTFQLDELAQLLAPPQPSGAPGQLSRKDAGQL